jgi:adenosyl cobinamide kinase/adenosyl cobinamide phosphate guanylyltransferase
VERSEGNVRESSEWRLYLVERYIEAVSKIVVSHELGEGETSFNRVSRALDDQASEMQHRIADSLSDFLDSGILPSENNE